MVAVLSSYSVSNSYSDFRTYFNTIRVQKYEKVFLRTNLKVIFSSPRVGLLDQFIGT